MPTKCKLLWLTEPYSIRKNQASPLLRLPAEIRNTIYEYAFTGRTVAVHFYSHVIRTYSPSQQSAIGVRQVCRQIRFETRSAFYKHTSFDFGPLPYLNADIAQLNPELYNNVQSVELTLRNSYFLNEMAKCDTSEQDYFFAMESTITLQGLKHVHLSFIQLDDLQFRPLFNFVRRMLGTKSCMFMFVRHDERGNA